MRKKQQLCDATVNIMLCAVLNTRSTNTEEHYQGKYTAKLYPFVFAFMPMSAAYTSLCGKVKQVKDTFARHHLLFR